MLCEPEPLPDSEIDDIWKSALDFVTIIRDIQKDQGKGNERHEKEEDEKEKVKKKPQYVQKYHHDENLLAEAVIIAGRPYFAVARPGLDEVQVTLEELIPLDDVTMKLKPLPTVSYINKPYVFSFEEEFDKFVDRAKGETLDSLYRRVKSIWRKYIDASSNSVGISLIIGKIVNRKFLMQSILL